MAFSALTWFVVSFTTIGGASKYVSRPDLRPVASLELELTVGHHFCTATTAITFARVNWSSCV